MKYFNNLKLVSSFREISNILSIISTVINVFALLLVVLQGVMLVTETKRNIKG